MGVLAPGLEADRLGPYRLIKLIRQGGQGRVYLGYDDRLRRRVAVKLLSRPDSRKLRKQLVKEARVAANLDSPHLVKIYDVVQAPAYLALVMEYVPGCDLEQLMAVTSLSQPSILSIISDIASALAAARRQGIVHGDVKAANVLITHEGRAKLTDFGIARAGGDNQEVGAGSPSAVSPEQLRGEALDARADIFALGCLVYHLLSGRHPYFDVDNPVVYPLHSPAAPLQAQALDGSTIHDDLRQLVDAMIQPSPDQRPASTHEVRRVVRTVRRSMPIGSGNTLLEEAQPWFRRETAIAEIASATVEGACGNSNPGRVAFLKSRNFRLAGSLGLLTALGISLAWLLLSAPLRVQINEPVVELSESAIAPDSVNATWLQAEVLAAARGTAMNARFAAEDSGPETTLSTTSVAAAASADESLDITLRCTARLCLLDLRREGSKHRLHQQAILLPGESLARWRELIQISTVALYSP